MILAFSKASYSQRKELGDAAREGFETEARFHFLSFKGHTVFFVVFYGSQIKAYYSMLKLHDGLDLFRCLDNDREHAKHAASASFWFLSLPSARLATHDSREGWHVLT